MPRRIDQRTFLSFMKKLIDVAVGYSTEDLLAYRKFAMRRFPAVVHLIEAYLDLGEKTQRADLYLRDGPAPQPRKTRNGVAQMHLFDLLRERRLFPQNAELAEFAGRILPNMPRRRFDKMSRGDIAARIIEYLETLSPQTRESLEASMRDALATKPAKSVDRQSFFSTWESIIKGV